MNVSGGEKAPEVSALLNTVFVEPAFLILLGVVEALSGTGVAEEVNNHAKPIFLSYDPARTPKLHAAANAVPDTPRLWHGNGIQRELPFRQTHKELLRIKTSLFLARSA